MSDGITLAFVDTPHLSVVMPTRDRPDFLSIALACYQHQTYAHRELIVVDDGDRFPVDPNLVTDVGGRLLHVEPGTPLGTKLNLGLGVASGDLCLKIDDDDWYGPGYLATMVAHLLSDWHGICRATIAVVTGFLAFDVARWEIRRYYEGQPSGGTLCFRREDWLACPFRPIPSAEDANFLTDQIGRDGRRHDLETPDCYVAVRHDGPGNNRGHLWRNEGRGGSVIEQVRGRPLHTHGPDDLFPPWALDLYRQFHRDRQDRS